MNGMDGSLAMDDKELAKGHQLGLNGPMYAGTGDYRPVD